MYYFKVLCSQMNRWTLTINSKHKFYKHSRRVDAEVQNAATTRVTRNIFTDMMRNYRLQLLWFNAEVRAKMCGTFQTP